MNLCKTSVVSVRTKRTTLKTCLVIVGQTQRVYGLV